LLLVVTLIAIIAVGCVLAELMISKGVRAGKYINPNVASQVVRGTIYDRNGRALAMEVPSYNLYISTDAQDVTLISQIASVHCSVSPDEIQRRLTAAANAGDKTVMIAHDLSSDKIQAIQADLSSNGIHEDQVAVRKEYERTYPAAFHAAQLIAETEDVYYSTLSPVPGFGESTTYGDDIYLNIDLDIQYLLDLAVQQVYDIQVPEYCVAFIADARTGEILAATTYPFYDLNDSDWISQQQKVSRTLVSSVRTGDVSISDLKVVNKITRHGSDAPVSDYTEDTPYTKDLEIVSEMINQSDGYTSIVRTIPEGDPRYLVFIGSVNPRFYKVSEVLSLAVESIRQGLSSQNKI